MIREFTRDDWYGFAGAEEFRDGAPLICEETLDFNVQFTAVADATGVSLYFYHESYEGGDPAEETFFLGIRSNSQKRQRKLLEGVLEELGVEPGALYGGVREAVELSEGFSEI